MAEEESVALLKEIRDLTREQLAVARESLGNQAQAIANQAQAIKRQEEYRRSIRTTRKWGMIVFWVIAGLLALFILQPLAFIWMARWH